MLGAMTMKPKTPIKRSKPLQSKGEMKRGDFRPKPLSALERHKAQQKALQKATLRELDKARKAAEADGVKLTEWEGDFLDGVTERVRTYGRAFADPEKGAPGTTLSVRQGVKLREIRKKTARKHEG